MTACIEKQNAVARPVQRPRQRQHHLGIATPAMQYRDSRRRHMAIGCYEPAKQALAAHGPDDNPAKRQPLTCRRPGFPNPRGAQTDMDQQMRQNRDPQQGQNPLDHAMQRHVWTVS